MKKRLFISVVLLASILGALPLYAQESCYAEYLREHNMSVLTAEDADDSYDELKKAVLAWQLYGSEASLPFAPKEEPAIPQLQDTTCVIVHLALVDSTWYMWMSVDPLADKYPGNTPYSYCNGNPIMLVDPDGRIVVYNDESGECENMVREYCSQSEMFNAVYQQLSESPNTYIFQFGETISLDIDKVDGQFLPTKSGGVITLNRDGAWQSSIPEEVFHALQRDNRGKYNEAELNLEFEAKVFVILSGLPTGSYYGMDDSYQSSLQKMDLNEFTQPQSIEEYIKQANMYSNYNWEKTIGNKNYWTPTNISPFNIISIIDKLK